METKIERRDRKNREKNEDEKRRKKEWNALVEESLTSLLSCHKCPIWSMCPHQKRELSWDLQFSEESERKPPYSYPPFQHRIDKFREGLKVMETVKESCPLLQGFTPGE